MYYKFEKTFEYVKYAEIEADSLEEAMEQLEDAEWLDDDGGEHYLTSKRILQAEGEYEASCGEYEEIEDTDW